MKTVRQCGMAIFRKITRVINSSWPSRVNIHRRRRALSFFYLALLDRLVFCIILHLFCMMETIGEGMP